MRIRIRTEGISISRESRGLFEDAFRLALGARLAPDVELLRLRLSNASGASPRTSFACHVEVQLRNGESVTFTERSDALRKTVETAAWRLERRLRRLTAMGRGDSSVISKRGPSGHR